MYNNLGKLERYRLVTIRGGERDWHPSPHFQWVIFRIPGWHCTAGVLLSAGGVLLSGHLEFPGHLSCVLQVSLCFPGHLSLGSHRCCRCPSVFLVTCHLGLSGPSHPINHNPDTLNFLELLLGCYPGHGVIQIPVLDEIRHPGFPAVWFTLDGIQSCVQIRWHIESNLFQ